MSSDTQAQTRYKHKTAALMTVFGLVPAAMFACPYVSGLPRNEQDLISYAAPVGALCVVCLPLLLMGCVWIIREARSKQDERNLLNGEEWVSWQYAPGEWQQLEEAKPWASMSHNSTPSVVIGPYGVYHQITGFKSIRSLRKINFRTPTEPESLYPGVRTTMSWLEFVLPARVGRQSGGYGFKSVWVGVPRGKEAEAEALMSRFIAERLQGLNG